MQKEEVKEALVVFTAEEAEEEVKEEVEEKPKTRRIKKKTEDE